MKIIPIIGLNLQVVEGGFRFIGGTNVVEMQGNKEEQANMGQYLTSEYYTGGLIQCTFNHEKIDHYSCSEMLVAYNPDTRDSLHVGIPRDLSLISVRAWVGRKWETIATAGDRSALMANTDYEIKCIIVGSRISVFCNGVKMIQATMPVPFQKSQYGLFFIGSSDIIVKNIVVDNVKPKAFVIMQFSSPYNEVYAEVIKNVCVDLGVDVLRIDENVGPGLILSDITQAIEQSAFVIADISPTNANVFYEVGYAHGIKKPTILIAERGTKLPFDVSPIRTLFYENSISGKPRLENGLSEYIKSILGYEK